MTYELIDSGGKRKLERFGSVLLDRPALQAVWEPQLPASEWKKADAVFTRAEEGQWKYAKGPLGEWTVEVDGICFLLSPTDFGHLGIFPEQRENWRWIQENLKGMGPETKALNLFAYSGGTTLALAKAGVSVCHLDASKKMVAWARENAAINSLEEHPIRWIVDDVRKFLKREIRRGNRYDIIALDPPTFGRGAKGEVFKIDDDIVEILKDIRSLLSEQPKLLLFSCHSPGYTALTLEILTQSLFDTFSGDVETKEMILEPKKGVHPLPSGVCLRCQW